jgi:broad specificity phosphatase PhoE
LSGGGGVAPNGAMTLFILARHAQSRFNLEERVNGDPSVPVELTERGAEQARQLGRQVAHVPIDLCVTTRFERARRTAEIALEGRAVPFREEPLLDDIDVGLMEGRTTAEYRAWKQEHSRRDPLPGGESLEQAGVRYARAFAALVPTSAQVVLVVCHEIPVRYALNAAAGSDSLEAPVHDVPNAAPFLFDTVALDRAAQAIERMTRTA